MGVGGEETKKGRGKKIEIPDYGDFGGNRATARVLLILSQFAHGSASRGVSELSAELGMTKNLVHRAFRTLTRHGFLVRDGSGTRYELGPGVLGLGRLGLEPLNLPLLAAPYLQRLQEISGETISLAIRAGRTSVTIAGLRGRDDIARRVPFGRSVPLHASPASRAILAFLPDPEINDYLGEPKLESFTKATLSSPAEIWQEVHEVRERGFALSFGDHVARGASGIAFPVFASDGTPHGSITVAGPSDRFTDARREEVVDDLLATIGELNRRSRLYPPERSIVGVAAQ